MMTARPVDSIQPITRTDSESLARTEYARMASQLRSLAPDDWSKPTDCPLWDVRAVAGHSLGMMATFIGILRNSHGALARQRAARGPISSTRAISSSVDKSA